MKKQMRYVLLAIVIILIAGILIFTCRHFFANREVDGICRDYLLWYKNHFPIEASNCGLSDSAGLLPDFSPDSVAAKIRQLQKFSKKIQRVNYDALTEKRKITYQTLKKQVRSKLFELQQWERWKKDANFYVQKMQDAIFPLSTLLTDSTEQFAAPLIYRLEHLPSLMTQLKKNLTLNSSVDREIALRRAIDLEKWMGIELRMQLRKYFQESDTTARLIDVVNDSLLKLINYLDQKTSGDTLIPFSASDYLTYVEIISGDSISISELQNSLNIQLQKMKNEMYRLAKEYFRLERKDISAMDTLRTIRAFDDEIKKEMLRRDQIEKFMVNLDGYTRKFIQDIADVDIEVNYPLEIKWEILKGEDPFKLVWRETFLSEKQNPLFVARLTPINGNKDLYEQLSILRRYNKPALRRMFLTEILPLHHHHWQQHSAELPPIVRFFPDKNICNSWPYFFTSYLLERGFSGYDRGVKFMFLKKLTSMTICAIIEMNIYFSGWGESEVQNYFRSNIVFMAESVSELKYKIYSQPAHDLLILIGLNQLGEIRLRHQLSAEKQKHPSLIYEQILHQGPIPISFIRQKLERKEF